MTINDILKTLEKHKGIVNVPYVDDLHQETVYRLLVKEGKEPGFIEALYNRGELDKYFVRSLGANAFQRGSKYQKAFKDNRFLIYKDAPTLEYLSNKQYPDMRAEINIMATCIGEDNYERNLFTLFLQGRSRRKIRQDTGIPMDEIKRVINKGLEGVEKEYKDELNKL